MPRCRPKAGAQLSPGEASCRCATARRLGTEPPRPAKQSRTDDRGFYRIGELEPGRYYVRSGPEQLEANYSILPTLHRETLNLDEAISVDVGPEDVAQEVIVHPIPGRLLRLTAAVGAPPNTGPWQIRLVSGQLVRTGAGPSAIFDRLPPGRYELYVDGMMFGYPASGYQEFELGRDQQQTVQVSHSTRLDLKVFTTGGSPAGGDWLVLEATRVTRAGADPPRKLDLPNPTLPAGKWRFDLLPTPQAYLASESRVIYFQGGPHVLQLQVSLHPAVITGKVLAALGQPAVGAPVYLEPFDPGRAGRTGPLRSTICGTQGDYRFDGLPPGNYRLISTFDMENPEPEFFTQASPKTARVKDAGQATVDLDLFNLP